MAENRSDQPDESAEVEELEFIGMSDVLALHADAFFVLQNGDNFNICFFQHKFPDLRNRAISKTQPIQTKETKCIARIAVSPLGFVNLAKALLQHAASAGLVSMQPPEEQS